MSYISPSGMIWLLHNVPLDKTYQNTLYWPRTAVGERQQREFFLDPNLIKYQFSNQYYTRHTKGSIRVQTLADNILDCNYLVFQNSSFPTAGGGKFFYAFITSVEYINNSVAQVNFEIDVIQTWYFEFDIGPCFVEREHASTDVPGDNIVPEPVDVGEYEYQGIYREQQTSALCIILSIVQVNAETGASQGKVYGHIYQGTTLWAFQPADVSGINAKIAEYVQKPESIVSMYMCPQCLISTEIPESGGIELGTADIVNGTETLVTALPIPSDTDAFGSYVPRNKKLYTYPFTFLEVFTPEGAKARYRYEFFDNRNPVFVYGGSVTQPVTLTLVPDHYKTPGSSWVKEPLYTEAIALKNYPMCSWNTDAYLAWSAQNSIPYEISAAGGLVSGLLTYMVNPVFGAMNIATQGIHTVTNLLAGNYKASIAADQMHGSANGSASISMEVHSFFFAKGVVNESSARIIDSFFDRYGYAVKKLQKPHTKQRRRFTYVKTVGCVIHGSVPADDEEKICQLHDAGITYWDPRNTSYASIGNFGLVNDNTPQTEEDM